MQLLRERLSLELFASQQSHRRFVDATWEVTDALSDWPLKHDPGQEQAESEENDTQVFALQQRAIGELVIKRDRTPRASSRIARLWKLWTLTLRSRPCSSRCGRC